MIQFDAAPAVPLDYPRLTALTTAEIEQARLAGYLASVAYAREPVRRAGLNNYTEPRADDDLQDWRTRMFIIWFCYIYENFLLIHQPCYAIEELILEFKAPGALDTLGRRLGTLYAGAGGSEPTSPAERTRLLQLLRPHYAVAIALLDRWNRREN